MIHKPTDLQPTGKKIRMLIAGSPGQGKSTLALSSPNPLHIDVDFGTDRINVLHRCPYIQPQSYDEVLSDLKPENVKEFDTLVFDTGGKLFTLIAAWARKKDPKYGQRDGSLSLRGYGAVAKEYSRLMNYAFYELNKNVITVFHAVEEKDGDATRLRIKVEGSTRNTAWEDVDLGGFMEMYGNDRTIGFSNCERYFAKGTHGIFGVRRIPELSQDTPNDFLTQLFNEYSAYSVNEAAYMAEQQAAYQAAMKRGHEIMETIKDADTANAAVASFGQINHALTSKRELGALWNRCMASRGLVYDKLSGKYAPAQSPSKAADKQGTAPPAQETL